jgi:hypothetical protein
MGLRDATIAALKGCATTTARAALLAFMWAAAPDAHRVDAKSAAARARDYLRVWQQSLAAVVAEEHYTQTLWRFPRGSDVVSLDNTTTTRTTVSDVLLVRAGGNDAWLLFRDVMVVDGERVNDRERRFDELFVRPDANLVATARKIADEGARYNLGTLFRNLNTPVTALIFLEDKYVSSVRWRDAGREEMDGIPVVRLSFEQKEAPYAIHSREGGAIPASGSIWVEPASGRIVQTEVTILTAKVIRGPRGRSMLRITSRFGAVPGLTVWVPLRMIEEYDLQARTDERLKAQATYTNHRLFQTATRIIGDAR